MTTKSLRAQSLTVSAEHCAWMIGQGYSIKMAHHTLGMTGPVQGWRRISAHVAMMWIAMQQNDRLSD